VATLKAILGQLVLISGLTRRVFQLQCESEGAQTLSAKFDEFERLTNTNTMQFVSLPNTKRRSTISLFDARTKATIVPMPSLRRTELLVELSASRRSHRCPLTCSHHPIELYRDSVAPRRTPPWCHS
jgi:hypothetical protein